MRRPEPDAPAPRDELIAFASLPGGTLATFAVGAVVVNVDSAAARAVAAVVLIAIIGIATSLGGRMPGMFTAVTAALSYDFFANEPVRTLHVGSLVRALVCFSVVGFIMGRLWPATPRRFPSPPADRE